MRASLFLLVLSIGLYAQSPETIMHNYDATKRIESANPYGHKYPGKTVVPRIRQTGKIDFRVMVHPREGYLKRYAKKQIRPGDGVTGWVPYTSVDERGRRPDQVVLDIAYFHNRELYETWYDVGLTDYVFYPFQWIWYKSSLDYFSYYHWKYPYRNVLANTYEGISHLTLDYEPKQMLFRIWYLIIFCPFIFLAYYTIVMLPFRYGHPGGIVGQISDDVLKISISSSDRDTFNRTAKINKEMLQDGKIDKQTYDRFMQNLHETYGVPMKKKPNE